MPTSAPAPLMLSSSPTRYAKPQSIGRTSYQLPSFLLRIFLFHSIIDVRTVASLQMFSSCTCNAPMGSAPYVHSVLPQVLSIRMHCDGERFLCSFRVVASALHRNALRWGALCMITPSHYQCSPLYWLAMGTAPYERDWVMENASHV
jgi:hypothetical protein